MQGHCTACENSIKKHAHRTEASCQEIARINKELANRIALAKESRLAPSRSPRGPLKNLPRAAPKMADSVALELTTESKARDRPTDGISVTGTVAAAVVSVNPRNNAMFSLFHGDMYVSEGVSDISSTAESSIMKPKK